MNNNILNYIKLSSDGTTLIEVDKDIETLDIPESVTKINKNVLTRYHKIKSLNGPNVIEIVRFDCFTIEHINLPNIKHIKINTFDNYYNLKTINIPNVEVIDYGGFFDCRNIEYIIAPRLYEIKSCVFYNCSNLEKIDAPLLCRSAQQSFYKCEKLLHINSKLNNEQLKFAFHDIDHYEQYLQRNSAYRQAVRDYKLNILDNEL